ncbi:MAG: murein biosynthesis integral membrane protein MurJ [Candidatus Promineifilaceae bacterium]
MLEVDSAEASQQSLSSNKGVVRAATVLAIGNIISRILGLVRDQVMTHYFGARLTSAYEAAALIPNNLFDAVKTGLVDSALVPVFSDISGEESREQLWSAVSAFLSVIVVILAGVVLLIDRFHRQVGSAIGVNNFDDPALAELAFSLMRLAVPAVLLLSIASILTAVLYALKRFTIPAFLPAIFNGSIITAAFLRPSEVSSLVIGLLCGALLQIVVQAAVLRDARIRWSFNPRHPAIGRIVTLFTPIVGVLLVDQVVRTISYRLAIGTGDASLNYMRRATTLFQFPMGLVVTALSIAILPVLAEQATRELSDFKTTLAGGIRLVLVLILPATFGLFALAMPIVDLLFGHGEYTPFDVLRTSQVLQVYLIGLPFAAVDQMLIFGSYARKNTLSPSIVGVISMIVNIGTAYLLIDSLGLFSLMVADAVKHIVHTILMSILLKRQAGGLAGYSISTTLGKALIAGIATGLAALGVSTLLGNLLPYTTLSEIITVASSGLVGIAVYLVCVYIFKIEEAKALIGRILSRG